MRACPLLFVVMAALPLAAQETEPERDKVEDWYRVELLIFANRDPEAAMSESWPLLPDLSYPEPLLLLRSDAPRVAADRELQLLRLEQLVPPPTFDLAWETPVEQLLSTYYERLLWRRPSVELEPLFDLDIPVAFALLPREQQEFATERRRLDSRSKLQVLFHEAWLQPMREQAETTPIAVDAGPVKGDFNTLQGSILLYRSRYLHLETNLWLNTDGSYLANDWVMPMPPLPPTAEDQTILPFEVLVTDNWLSPAAPIEEPQPAEPVDELAHPPPLTEAELQAFLDSPEYSWRHALLLQQQRRMRGGELHYIDHPMFGLLIKVTRYEFEPFVDTGLNLDLAGRR